MTINRWRPALAVVAVAAGADVEEFWRVVAVVEYNPLFQTIQPQWPGRYCPAQTAAVVRKQTSRLKQKAAKSDDISQSVSPQWRVNSRDWGPWWDHVSVSAERGHQATSGSAIFLKNMFLGNSFHYVLNDVVGKLLFCSIVQNCFDENSSSMLRHSLIGNLPSRAEIYFGCRVARARDLLSAHPTSSGLNIEIWWDRLSKFLLNICFVWAGGLHCSQARSRSCAALLMVTSVTSRVPQFWYWYSEKAHTSAFALQYFLTH